MPEQKVCMLANNKEVNSVDAPDSEGANNEKKGKGHLCSTYWIENYTINIYAHLMIQMLGLGWTALDTILGMLGIVAHAGSKPAWALLHGAVGVVQHNLADHIQVNNLDKEIMAMKAASISEVEHNGEKR